MIIGRSDSWQDAVFLLGALTPTGRLAARCGSHLGQRSSTASKGRTHGALSTRFHHAQPLQPGGRSLIAAPTSTAFFCPSALPGVTVLSAVGVCRRNIWSEAQALQCPQRAHAETARPNGLPRSWPAPSPR